MKSLFLTTPVQKPAFNHLISCFRDKYSVLCPRFRYLGVESAEIKKRIKNELWNSIQFNKLKY